MGICSIMFVKLLKNLLVWSTVFVSVAFSESDLLDELEVLDKSEAKRKYCEQLREKIKLNEKEIKQACGPNGDTARCIRAIKMMIQRLIAAQLHCDLSGLDPITGEGDCANFVVKACRNLCGAVQNSEVDCFVVCGHTGVMTCIRALERLRKAQQENKE